MTEAIEVYQDNGGGICLYYLRDGKVVVAQDYSFKTADLSVDILSVIDGEMDATLWDNEEMKADEYPEAVEKDTLLYRWVRGSPGKIDPDGLGLDLSFREYLLPLDSEIETVVHAGDVLTCPNGHKWTAPGDYARKEWKMGGEFDENGRPYLDCAECNSIMTIMRV